jgi:hypothetical protein
VVSEDMMVHGMLGAAGGPLYVSGWADRTGLSVPHPSFPSDTYSTDYTAWTRNLRIDLDLLREYAKAVYAATDKYLASLTPEALDQTIEIPDMGTPSLAFLLGRFLVAHVDNMTGEISAIKGIQGARGYPF